MVVKRAIPQVILNNKELQPIITVYFQCEQDWKVSVQPQSSWQSFCSLNTPFSSTQRVCGKVHAQMHCHPETKSKVRPKKIKIKIRPRLVAMTQG